ncbi:MAG TPA: hypothetical protein VNO21_12180 [Polyangiaceae bacterium]|nr:hypothetical protein [Polyangiaceae bacterium]
MPPFTRAHYRLRRSGLLSTALLLSISTCIGIACSGSNSAGIAPRPDP